MPLLVPPAPAPALLSVLAALSSPTAVLEARTPALRTAEGPLAAEHPLPVHVFEPAAVPGALPQARLTGWRFHIRAGARVAAAGETVVTPDGWVFSRFSEGPFLVSIERALIQRKLAWLSRTRMPRPRSATSNRWRSRRFISTTYRTCSRSSSAAMAAAWARVLALNACRPRLR